MAQHESTLPLGEPAIVVVCGPAGVGKTSVAEYIADLVDGRLLRTDVIRKELFDAPEYTAEESRRVYEELFDRARSTAATGGIAVLDATFRSADRRERAATVAESVGAAYRVVKVECDREVVRDRIAQRESDASDADFEVHLQHLEEFDPLVGDYITVDNSGRFAETARGVQQHFEPRV